MLPQTNALSAALIICYQEKLTPILVAADIKPKLVKLTVKDFYSPPPPTPPRVYLMFDTHRCLRVSTGARDCQLYTASRVPPCVLLGYCVPTGTSLSGCCVLLAGMWALPPTTPELERSSRALGGGATSTNPFGEDGRDEQRGNAGVERVWFGKGPVREGVSAAATTMMLKISIDPYDILGVVVLGRPKLRRGGVRAHFVACRSRLTIGHASLSRR